MQRTPKRSLVVVLSLPKGKTSSTFHPLPMSSTAPAVAVLPTYDRKFWACRARDPSALPVASVLQSLGIKHANERARFGGITKFGVDGFARLVKAIKEVAADLPESKDELLDLAEDSNSLREEVAALLMRFGAEIWGGEKARPWLLKASDGMKEYPKDLVFEREEDKEVLAYHIRLWIFLKAFNSSRNKHYANSALAKVLRNPRPISTVTGSARSAVGLDATTPVVVLDEDTTSAHEVHRSTRRKRDKNVSPEVIVVSDDSDSDMDDADQILRDILQPQPRFDSELQPSLFGDLALENDGRSSSNNSVATDHFDGAVTKACSISAQTQERGMEATASTTEGTHSIAPVQATNFNTNARDENPAGIPNDKSHDAAKISNQYILRIPRKDSGHSIDKNPQDSSFAPETSPANLLPMAKRGFPLHAYWSETSWRRFIVYNHVSMPTIIACLGLACRRVLHVGLVLDHATGTALQVAVGRIALKLSEKLDVDDMPEHAADSNYLNEEIDELFERFAARLWGQDSNRKLLLTPGTDSAYPKHLVYENDGDRKLLWIHLHRWIFASAFALLRPEKPNSRISSKVLSSKSPANGFTGDDDGRGAHISAVVLKDTQRQCEKRGKHTAQDSIEDQAPLQKKTKQDEFTDVPVPVRKATTTTPNVGRIRYLVLEYLHAYGKPDFNEVLALEGMENEYKAVAPLLHGSSFPLKFPVVFNAWLNYRYTVLAIKTDATTTHCPKLSEMESQVKRMRLVVALRMARDAFMAAGDETMSADLTMVLGVAGLTKVSAEDDRIVEIAKCGLKKLDVALANLAVEIGGAHDGKWVVMG